MTEYKEILSPNFGIDGEAPTENENQANPASPSKPSYVYETPKIVIQNQNLTSIDNLLIMDLDAYNYISAFLFQGMGTEERDGLDLPARQLLFKQEFLSNARIFETLANPELLPLPTLKRLSIAVALLAIEELAQIRREQNDHPVERTQVELYELNKRMAKCYQRLIEFLTGDSLSIQEKNDELLTSMLVEFKSLYFLSELAAGRFNGTTYESYVCDHAKVKLKEMVNLSVYEQYGFSDEVVELLKHQLTNRRLEIEISIDKGEVSLDTAISLANEQTLVKCLMGLSINANTEMLPVLHPGYHAHSSLRVQQSCKELVQKFRTTRSKPVKPNPLGLKANVQKPVKHALVNSTSTPSGDEQRKSRKRKIWTEEETQALADGMAAYGTDWVTIKAQFPVQLADRDPVALKDRARSMRKIFERAGKHLGVWGAASARNT